MPACDLLLWDPLEKVGIWPYNKSLIDQDGQDGRLRWLHIGLVPLLRFNELNLISVHDRKNTKKT